MPRRVRNHSRIKDCAENNNETEHGSENDSGSEGCSKTCGIFWFVLMIVIILVLLVSVYWTENARKNAKEYALKQNKLCTTDLCQRWRNSLVDKTKNDIEEALREAQCKISFKIDALVDCESSLEYILKEVPDANGLHCSNDEFNTFYYLNWCKGD